MLLKSFTIKNYRSIFEIKNMEFSKTLTTFIGKNNQGKSNILKAISLVFDMVSYYASLNYTRRLMSYRDINYSWDNDFPEQRQNKQRYNQSTIISVTFALDSKDEDSLQDLLKMNISQELIIETTFYKDQRPNLKVYFRRIAKGKFNDNELIIKICNWLSNKITFQYIPAIRTDELADNIANSIISLELSQLAPQKKEKLESALTQIAELQKPILKKLAQNLSSTLKDFIPDIKKVTFDERRSSYRYARRYSDDTDFYIKIDDGSNTVLEQKGDGIKSLVTLGMMRQKGHSSIGRGLILAIEEPESHLHPEAIRQISRVINDISLKNQIILTSHSPLFVNRNNILENIIVENNSAYKPTNIRDIRNTLGVIVSDNLINAEFMLVVEGLTDKNFLKKYFISNSKILKKLFEEGRLDFEILNGVCNLEHSLNRLSNMSSKYFCILDSDQISIDCVKKSKASALLSTNLEEISYYTIEKNKETELEDLINPELYKDYVRDKLSINILDTKSFKSGTCKWSKKMELALNENGKRLNNDELKEKLEDIKIYISKLNIKDDILIKNKQSSITKIIQQIEKYFIPSHN